MDLRLEAAHLAPAADGYEALVAAQAHGSVYGLTTGVGALRQVDLEEEEAVDGHARRLWRSHAACFGPEVDDSLARATMLVRLHQLLRGGSGVHPDLVAGLSTALAADALPSLRAFGSIGTADLPVLAQLGLTLVGELPWRSNGVAATNLHPSDALPFLSSNAMTLGAAAIHVDRTVALLRGIESVAALSHMVVRGSLEAYDHRVHAAASDDHATAIARRMANLLAGPPRESARVQDPFGFRTLPQVHAAAEAAAAHAVDVIEIGVRAAAENPLVVPGAALHHGQFVTQRLASAVDSLRAAMVPVLSLSLARLSSMLDPKVTHLPAFLAAGPSGSSGLMITEYVVADLLARATTSAQPVTSARTVISLGTEDHASHSTWATWQLDDLCRLVPEILACELVAAVRGARMAPGRVPATVPAARLARRAEARWAGEESDHILGPELDSASALFTDLVAGQLDDI
ncbi:aromatic amino acid lyase [Nocardioides sp.]|uniref:aromatic amino acid lyase n=1 Tax=Nocardioides sp. TaxID=35761 RepID=UPI0035B1CD72